MNLLLQSESALKTCCVYAFCKTHTGADDYLDPSNYCQKNDYHDKKNYTKGLIRLLSTLQAIRDNAHHKTYIKHYIDTYNELPLWVASKCLTFGNMASFFEFQQQSVKTRTCNALERALGVKPVKQAEITYAFRTLPNFRNICAHNERLYCARTGKGRTKGFPELLKALSYTVPKIELSRYAASIIELLEFLNGSKLNLQHKILTGMNISIDDLKSYVIDSA